MTNHNPNITSSAATGSFSEDANTTGSTVDHVLTGTMNFTDSDRSDTHTTTTALKTAVWSGGSTLPVGALTKFQAGMTSSILSDSNGSGKLKWTFSEDDRDFDFLAKGETLVLTYEITLRDNRGGTNKETVKITITGTDDKPVFATTAGATLSEQANKTLSLSHDTANIALQFTDVDLNNTGHTASVLSVSATGNTSGILPGSLGTAELMSFFDIQNVVKNSSSSNGTVNTKFSAPDLAFDYLAAGEQIVITYVVQVDDRKGGLSTQNVVVTVNGTNDKPVVIGFPECVNLTEGEDLSGGNLVANGDFVFSDIDLSDTHTVSTTVTATRSGGGTIPISEAELIAAMGAALADDPDSPGNPNNSTGDLFGKVSWTFALSDSDVNFLAEGEVLTLTYHIIVTDPSGASDSEEVTIKIVGTADPSLTKTATVDGGTADTVGEVIFYTITYSNDGSGPLTGVTVTDPSVSDLTFVGGDTDGDNQLDAGETWQYTASHTVTQGDIDGNGGGDGLISNTVTADSDQTDPVTASASVSIDRRPIVTLVKTANVASVNAAGNVITYTIAVQNTGNASLTGLQVTDPQVNVVTPVLDFSAPILGPETIVPILGPSGEYNIGDTNESGFEDPGETFQYQILGDDNNNGVEDPGETFVRTNVGDTNQNGMEDPGETFQYYNAGDTDHDGVEDPGETFQFNVSHDATPVDANADNFNDGDTNFDNAVNVGETWQYTVSYTVTQDDIDNGGVVDPLLAHDNTATVTTAENAIDDDTESVSIVQDPRVTLVKSATVADGAADEVGDVINYTINVANAGNMTLTGIDVTDPSVDDLVYVSGDTDSDDMLDLGETWVYTASHTVTQEDIDNGPYDNTSSVTTDQGDDDADANDSDTASVPIVQSPSIVLDKTATVPGGTADTVGEVIDYAITVTNDGNMTLSGVSVTDPSVSDLEAVESGGFNAGDLDQDDLLDVGEIWQYAASHTVTQGDLEAGGSIDNTASVTTGEGASDSDTASVAVAFTPIVDLDFTKAALGFRDLNGNDLADEGDEIVYTFTLTNSGNVTLHNLGVTDADSQVMVEGDPIDLAPGITDSTTWSASYEINSVDVGLGYKDNTAVAASDEISVSSGTVHAVLAMLNELP